MGEVKLEVGDGVAWITLSRPEKLNALGGDMRVQLRDRIAQVASGELAPTLVLRGEGDAFCAGGDVEAMRDLRAAGDSGRFRELLHEAAEALLALQSFAGVTIAAIDGVAAGAGLGLALNCDLRFATPASRLIASWSRIGLAPDWGATFWLPQLCGYGKALEIVLSGRPLEAEEAERVGLIHRVVDPEELVEEVERVAAGAAASEMVRQTKYLLRKGLRGPLEASLAAETEVQEDLFESDDVAEGLASFFDKRPPRFRGQ